MSIFHEEAFQAEVKKAKRLRIWNLARCIYCWFMIILPFGMIGRVLNVLSRPALWVYVITAIILFFWGLVVWFKGCYGFFTPLHKPLTRFLKKPSPEALRRICAVLVSNRKDRRWPKVDYDQMRKVHTICERNPEIIPAELLEFYTVILHNCGVAGV